MKQSFYGGVHPNDRKEATRHKAVTPLGAAPQQVVIAMSMHIGAPCKSVVAKGCLLYTSFMGDGGQVEHGVGGTAQGHVNGLGVVEGGLGHDVPGTDVRESLMFIR